MQAATIYFCHVVNVLYFKLQLVARRMWATYVCLFLNGDQPTVRHTNNRDQDNSQMRRCCSGDVYETRELPNDSNRQYETEQCHSDPWTDCCRHETADETVSEKRTWTSNNVRGNLERGMLDVLEPGP